MFAYVCQSTGVHVWDCVNVQMCIYVGTAMHMCRWVGEFKFACVYTCMHVYTGIQVCVHVCTCVTVQEWYMCVQICVSADVKLCV